MISRGISSVWSAMFGSASWIKGFFSSGSASVSGPYNSTDPQRKVVDPSGSAVGTGNELLHGNLWQLTSQLRQLERNNATVRGLVEARRAELIGTGITVIPDTGDPDLDSILQSEWDRHRAHIGIAGDSDTEMQRLWCSEIDVSGNGLGRYVRDTARKESGLAPIAVLPIETEWLSQEPVAAVAPDHGFCAGVEYDKYGRRHRYHLQNPETGRQEVVTAEDMIHTFDRRRALQVIGEPRLVAAIERALQRGRLIDAELRSAVNAASYTSKIKSDFPDEGYDEGETDSNGQKILTHSAVLGAHINLSPGEDFDIVQTNRPNTGVGEFSQFLNGDLAAASGCSRVWLDRDGSKYNFANSRFDQIRTNMVLSPQQMLFGHQTVGEIYCKLVPYFMAMHGKRMPMGQMSERVMRYRLQPDVPPEHDEKAAAQAFDLAWRNGITNHEIYLGSRGKSWEKVFTQRAKEAQFAQQIADEYGVPVALVLGGLSAPTVQEEKVPPKDEDEDKESESEEENTEATNA